MRSAGVLRTRFAAVFAACVVVGFVVPQAACAFESPNAASSAMLVDAPKTYDGQTIEFQGEVIGEAMVRDDHVWLHLNDDAYMYRNVEEGAPLDGYNSGMPVWLPKELAARAKTFGDYKHEGDVVEVAGVFNAACTMHGGDMDIHATDLRVVIEGRRAEDPVKPWKIPLVMGLAVAAAVAFAAQRRLDHGELSGVFRRS